MRFRTVLSPSNHEWHVDHKKSLLFLGSCFAKSIGDRFAKAKFRTSINPWGTLYHPDAILQNLQAAIHRTELSTEGIIQLGSRLTHHKVHSDITASNQEELIDLYTSVNNHLCTTLVSTDFAFITMGTAWQFYHKELKVPVANCHKQPSNLFHRVLSSPEEIQKTLQQIITLLRAQNPAINIIITISPVRHVRDGLIENNRSKAHLLTACHYICESEPSIFYFPSYELLLDDLRDYRFFKSDLVHPTEDAIRYIWEYLINHHMELQTKEIIKKAKSLELGFQHRSFDPASEEHRSFLKSLLSRMIEIESTHGLDYADEIRDINKRLDNLAT